MDKDKPQKENHNAGHRKRLKEKFDTSSNTLADYEILELLLSYAILRKDVKPMAKDMIKVAGDISNIFNIDYKNIQGAGRQTERFFNVIKEFFNRIENGKSNISETITHPSQIYRLLKYQIGFAEDECFAVILLNSKGQLIDKKILTKGIVNEATVYPRQIAEYALDKKAVSVIIAHNHPSGDITPTEKDIEITKTISGCLSILGIKLKDHIIVSRNEYASLFNLGCMDYT